MADEDDVRCQAFIQGRVTNQIFFINATGRPSLRGGRNSKIKGGEEEEMTKHK